MLTRDVGLPVSQALPDILHPEFFSGRAVLIITLQPTNNNSSLLLGEEFRAVGEVLDDPERHEPCNDCRQTFQNKNPRPARFPTDSIHLCDRGLLGRRIKRSSRGGEFYVRRANHQMHLRPRLQRRKVPSGDLVPNVCTN